MFSILREDHTQLADYLPMILRDLNITQGGEFITLVEENKNIFEGVMSHVDQYKKAYPDIFKALDELKIKPSDPLLPYKQKLEKIMNQEKYKNFINHYQAAVGSFSAKLTDALTLDEIQKASSELSQICRPKFFEKLKFWKPKFEHNLADEISTMVTEYILEKSFYNNNL